MRFARNNDMHADPPFAVGEIMPTVRGSGLLQKSLFAIGIVLTAYFLYLIMRQVDFPRIYEILRKSDIAYLMLGILALVLAYTFRTMRLHFILSPFSARSTRAKCAKAILVGVALNNVYPFRLGDLYRIVAFRETLGVDGAKMLGALVVERVIDLSFILMCLAVALVLLPPDVLDSQVRSWCLVLMLVAITAFVLMLFTPRPLRRLLAWFRVENRILRSLLRFADRLLEGVASAVTPRSLLVILALALAGWTFEIPVLSWTAAQAIGLETSYASSLLGLVLANLSTLFPSAPGFIGTFDYFAMLGITSSGGDANEAAAFAIVTHTTIWIFTTLCGLGFLLADWYRRLRASPAMVK